MAQPTNPLGALQDSGLKLILSAAFGPLATDRLEFLKTSKALYHNGALWGRKARFFVGRYAPEHWLCRRKSIKNIAYNTGPAYLALSAQDVVVLKDAKIDIIAVSCTGAFATTRPPTAMQMVVFRDCKRSPPWLRPQLSIYFVSPSDIRNTKYILQAMPTIGSLAFCNEADSYIFGRLFYDKANLDDQGLFNEICAQGINFCTMTLPFLDLKVLDGIERFPLRGLNLKFCRSLRTLEKISEMKQLTWLDISGCDSMVDISSISRLPLTYLGYGGCQADTCMETVALLSATLVNLNLNCGEITDAGLQILGQSGMRLKTLSLIWCEKITAAGIAHLADMPLKTLKLRGTGIRLEDCPPRLRHCIRI
jgi:hypothetical protein